MYLFKTYYQNLLKITILAALFVNTVSNAGVIYYSGIGVEGTLSNTQGFGTVSEYNQGLYREHFVDVNTYSFNVGSQFKMETNFTNPFYDTYVDGDGREITSLISGNVESILSASFTDQSHADNFNNNVDNQTFNNTLANAVLKGMPTRMGYSPERNVDQIRVRDDTIENTIFSDNGFDSYAVEYSLASILPSGANYLTYHNQLTQSILDYFYHGSENLYHLTAVEQDLIFKITEDDNNEFVESTYSQRLWFNDKNSAQSALDFFEDSMTNHTLYVLTNSQLVSGLSVETNELSLTSVEVPEPHSLALFIIALLFITQRLPLKKFVK